MTAILIPSSRLSLLRRRRGLVEYRQRTFLCCRETFRSPSTSVAVCNGCKADFATINWEFVS